MDVLKIEEIYRIAADLTRLVETRRREPRRTLSEARGTTKIPNADRPKALCKDREGTARPLQADLPNGEDQDPARYRHEGKPPICRTDSETHVKERSELTGRAIRGDDQPNGQS